MSLWSKSAIMVVDGNWGTCVKEALRQVTTLALSRHLHNDGQDSGFEFAVRKTTLNKNAPKNCIVQVYRVPHVLVILNIVLLYMPPARNEDTTRNNCPCDEDICHLCWEYAIRSEVHLNHCCDDFSHPDKLDICGIVLPSIPVFNVFIGAVLSSLLGGG